MRTFGQKPKATQKTKSVKSKLLGKTQFGRSHGVTPILNLQRTCGEYPKCQVEQLEQELPRLQVDSNDSGQTAVPPSVPEVLRSAGQPLNAAIRAFMEPRFGYDFSHVRVHADARAAESARDLNASAYTVGSNIVFGAGQFLPETQTGRQLLSHELTHVVQQRCSSVPVARGVSVPGDFHERQAGAVADALMRGGDIARLLDFRPGPVSHSLQLQPAPPPLQPLKYDRTIFHVPPVPAGQTTANLMQLLNKKVKEGKITSFSTKGGTGNAEIFLQSLLYSLAERSRWGTEADVVVAIDWPAKPGNPAPQGQVTVRIDSNGAASAELIARGVPAVTQQTTAAALRTNFKLASVTDDGTATWSPAELNDVGEALTLLPPADKAALEDVELIRVASIPGKPADAGQFEFPQPVASKAEFVNIHAKLRLANIAFTHDTLQFFGGRAKIVPASFQTILHEVGHAVESEVYRSRWRAHAQALAETKAAGNVQESDARKKERQEVEEKIQTTKNKAEKDRLQKKLDRFDLELALRADKATDKKAAETKLKEKEKEVMDMDAAGQTQRLKEFLDLVNRNRIAPFTDYSRQGDKEFYAEAYSLWLTDPEFLRTNYRVVFDFFQKGDYRK